MTTELPTMEKLLALRKEIEGAKEGPAKTKALTKIDGTIALVKEWDAKDAATPGKSRLAIVDPKAAVK